VADNDNPNAATAGVPIEAANSVIQQIFAVSLTLASSAHMIDGPAAKRLATASNDLDAIIAGLRKTALKQIAQPTNTPADAAKRPALSADRTVLTDRLGVVAHCADHLCRSATIDGADLIQLLDATHCIYRAVVSLASQPFSLRPNDPLPDRPMGQRPQ
jgi:hypothetical protein